MYSVANINDTTQMYFLLKHNFVMKPGIWKYYHFQRFLEAAIYLFQPMRNTAVRVSELISSCHHWGLCWTPDQTLGLQDVSTAWWPGACLTLWCGIILVLRTRASILTSLSWEIKRAASRNSSVKVNWENTMRAAFSCTYDNALPEDKAVLWHINIYLCYFFTSL